MNKLNRAINWEIFRTRIEEALYVEPKAPGGRSPYDKLMMFKIVILQKYYNLSDEQTEFQIKDRLLLINPVKSEIRLLVLQGRMGEW